MKRKLYCSIKSQKFETKDVIWGIPQGSCMGLHLIIMYLNDFERCSEFLKASMYTDDIHARVASNDIEGLIKMFKEELLNIASLLGVHK